MALSVPRMSNLSRRAGFRALVALALAAGFVAIARLSEPAPTTAQPEPAISEPTIPSDPVRADDQISLGALEGPDHTVHIFTTARGPRYAVVDGFGALIATDLAADEVHQFLPGFDIGSIRARVRDGALLAGPLMLADYD